MLEYGLGVSTLDKGMVRQSVLTLLMLEYGLGERLLPDKWIQHGICLNPSYAGIWSRGLNYIPNDTWNWS